MYSKTGCRDSTGWSLKILFSILRFLIFVTLAILLLILLNINLVGSNTIK